MVVVPKLQMKPAAQAFYRKAFDTSPQSMNVMLRKADPRITAVVIKEHKTCFSFRPDLNLNFSFIGPVGWNDDERS